MSKKPKNLLSIFNNVNKRDSYGLTPLYRAARHGNTRLVKRLLQKGADVNMQTDCGFTPLHIAAFWGEFEIVQMLLQKGADPNITNGAGWSPLHSASLSAGLEGRKRVIECLSKHGAKIDAKDDHGWTPKDYAELWDQPNNPRLRAIIKHLKQDKTETTGHQPDLKKLGMSKNGPADNDNKPPKKLKKDQIPPHHR